MRWAFAVAGPVAVVTAWLWSGGFFDAEDAAPADEAPSNYLKSVAKLVATDPVVVVVGNSQAANGVDASALTRELGVNAINAAQGGALAPTSYAILKRRVFGDGATPKVVVLAMSLEHLLDTTLPVAENRVRFEQVVGGPDPVLDLKVRKQRWPRLEEAVGHLQVAREAMMAWVTTSPVRLVGSPDPVARMETARVAVLGEVGGAQVALNARMIPVVEGGGSSSASGPVDIDDSLLPDLTQLVTEAGAKLVVATMPQRRRQLATSRETVTEISGWMRTHGVGLVVLDDIPVPSNGWRDSGHLNPVGAALYTKRLAAALTEMGALEDAPLRPLPPPLPRPVATRTGDPPPPTVTALLPTANPCRVRLNTTMPRGLSDGDLMARGLGNASPLAISMGGTTLSAHGNVSDPNACTAAFVAMPGFVLVSPPSEGPWDAADVALSWTPDVPHGVRYPGAAEPEPDGWFVPAGGALTLTWPDGLDVGADGVVEALVVPTQGGAPRVSLVVDGASTALKAWDHLAYGSASTATTVHTITIDAADNPEHAFIKGLTLVREGQRAWLAGQPTPRVDALEITPEDNLIPSTELPDLPLGDAKALARTGTSWPLTGAWTKVDMTALTEATGDPTYRRCAPLRAVSADGPTLKVSLQVRDGNAEVVFADADAYGAPYALRSATLRGCSRNAWIGPGEEEVFSVRSASALHTSTTEWAVRVSVMTDEGNLRFTLADVAGPLATWEGPAAEIGRGREIILPLSRPVHPDPTGLTVTVAAPASTWVLLGRSILRSASPPADAWFVPPPALAAPAGAVHAEAPSPDVVAADLPAASEAAPGGGVDLHAIVARGALADLALAPREGPVVTPAEGVNGEGVRLHAEGRAIVCLPDIAATGPLRSEAKVRLDGASTPGAAVLDVRWLDAGGLMRDVPPAVSRAPNTWDRWVVMTLDATPPDGATTARVCLRRAGEGDLMVGAWTAGTSP